jgi:hypothetical protein
VLDMDMPSESQVHVLGLASGLRDYEARVREAGTSKYNCCCCCLVY